MRSVWPSEVRGSVGVPSSKSAVQRLLAIGLLTEGTSEVAGVTLCDDVLATIEAVRALGAEVRIDGHDIRIRGPGRPRPAEVPCRESGLCLRMMTPVAALVEGTTRLVAEGSLRSRPVADIVGPLEALGARGGTSGGLPPVTVSGPMEGGAAEISGRRTSQFVTGLLIALPRAPADSILRVDGLRSAPYVEMTIDLLGQAGARISRDGLERFVIPGSQAYVPRRWTAEGDWSGAAFLLAAGALAGEVRLRGLSPSSLQGDRAVVEALAMAGAEVAWDGEELLCRRGSLRPFSFDATHCPDLVPPLAAVAACAPGVSVLRGSDRLHHKESDRVAALREAFGSLGIDVREEGDVLRIAGGRPASGRVRTRGDHRIAMAAAVLGIAASGPVLLDDPGCVAKSYPGFMSLINI
ncbi:3-phosphoshikimate 1-carboxyvinyltransferase, partial [Myxococcota bacterium]|nr:3-phosphoshikimate 1-carboxyvinyltransferase [Myxococcota bacterium]